MSFAWMSNPQYLAQVGHFLGACLVVFAGEAFWGHVVMMWIFGGGLLLAGVKEFVFDTASWGEGDSWEDSLMDFSFYMLGACVGLGMSLIAIEWKVSFT